MAKRSEGSPGTAEDVTALHASAAAVLDALPPTAALPPTTAAPATAAAPVAAPPRTPAPAKRQRSTPSVPRTFHASQHEDHGSNRQAELFYLQKQIQQQTPMIFIMEDGARVQGVIEWYDRNSIKVRGKSRVLVFKSAIKYLYKAGEIGAAPGE
jgi:sRNA-binding regulator protein Hfq